MITVYCVPDLEIALDRFKNDYGIEAIIGGRHLDQGTKNAIVSLGQSVYLELLAIDKSSSKNIEHHWMGIDYLTSPKITRWAIVSDQINEDLKTIAAYKTDLAKSHQGSRVMTNGGLLSWQMSLPSYRPEVELMPFLLNWSESDHHPTEQLRQQAKIIAFDLYHPAPNDLQTYFEQLDLDIKIQAGTSSMISLTLEGPKGRLTL